jgi:hypothetical protein
MSRYTAARAQASTYRNGVPVARTPRLASVSAAVAAESSESRASAAAWRSCAPSRKDRDRPGELAYAALGSFEKSHPVERPLRWREPWAPGHRPRALPPRSCSVDRADRRPHGRMRVRAMLVGQDQDLAIAERIHRDPADATDSRYSVADNRADRLAAALDDNRCAGAHFGSRALSLERRGVGNQPENHGASVVRAATYAQTLASPLFCWTGLDGDWQCRGLHTV